MPHLHLPTGDSQPVPTLPRHCQQQNVLRPLFPLVHDVEPAMMSERMPQLSLSKTQLIVSAVLVGAASTGIEILYAGWIGFPVPFTIHLMGLPYMGFMFSALVIIWYPHMRHNVSLLWKMVDGSLICVCHGFLIHGYPLFYFVFVRVRPGFERAVFTLMLPVLKFIYRVFVYYLCRSASGDCITIVVVFNADLVNALFVNFCMQFEPSLTTTGGLMVANTVQVVLMVRDIDAIRKKIAATTNKIIALRMNDESASEVFDRRSTIFTASMLPRVVDIFQRYSFDTVKSAVLQVGTSATRIVLNPQRQNRVGPLLITDKLAAQTQCMVGPDSVVVELELLERKYAILVRKLMYASEFSILTAFAEVITPIVYSLYLVIIFHMPNRSYYTQLASMNPTHLANTVLNVLLYSLVEFISFVVLSQTLKRRLNFSTLHQLAFVLDRQMIHVQAAIVMWVFYTTQTSLYHYGTDYTFKFAWLKSNSTIEN